MKIGYSKTFPVIGKDQWEKNWLEDEVNLNLDYLNLTDADIEKAMANVKRVQYALKKQVETFFYESKAVDAKQSQSIQEKEPEIKIGVTPEDVLSCETLKALDVYKFLVKNKPKLQDAYDQRFLELSK